MKTNSPIVVVGSINADMIARARRIPAPGETLTGDAFMLMQGGKGANQAVAARRCGASVAMVGCVGGDSLGDVSRQSLAAEGLDLSFLRVDSATTTGAALIVLDANGENAITVVPGANGSLNLSDIERIPFERYRAAVFQLETPLEVVWSAIAKAKAEGCQTVLTPAPAVVIPTELLPAIDFLIPNEHEVRLLLAGGETLTSEEAAQHLVSAGAGTVLLTLGAAGVAVVDKTGVRKVDAFKVKAVDTVGAGDCFSGVFVTFLMEGATVLDAVKAGCAAAALSVQRAGAQASYPQRAEIAALLAANERSV